MKWLACGLVALNGLIWFAGDVWVPEATQEIVTLRNLPRVSTLKVDAQSGSEANESEGQVIAKSKPPLSECVRLGWFDTTGDAVEAYELLGRPGHDYTVYELERALSPLYWIIIPPQPEDQALMLLSDLQQRGIDSYLVTRGENRNAISLGLFQSKKAAQSVLEAKKRQNLNAVLANFPRNQISYVLVFEVSPASDADVGGRRIRDYQEDFEMVEISSCEGVATTPENP